MFFALVVFNCCIILNVKLLKLRGGFSKKVEFLISKSKQPFFNDYQHLKAQNEYSQQMRDYDGPRFIFIFRGYEGGFGSYITAALVGFTYAIQHGFEYRFAVSESLVHSQIVHFLEADDSNCLNLWVNDSSLYQASPWFISEETKLGVIIIEKHSEQLFEIRKNQTLNQRIVAAKIFWRINEKTRLLIYTMIDAMFNQEPFLFVHIRRGDKLMAEANKTETDVYFRHVKVIANN